MKFYQETTVWSTDYQVPNHIYYMTDDRSKAVGYIRAGTKHLVKFSSPMSIDGRGRKFTVLPKKGEADEVYFPKTEHVSNASAVEVQGSGGKKYYLTKSGGRWRCTCPGYTFRHTCKHTTTMKN